jgi:capsule polysaccharide export protein KpsE/RkpR
MRVMTLVGACVLETVLSGCSLSTGTPPPAIQAPKETQVIQAPEETPEVKMRRATAQGQQLLQQAKQLSNQGTGESLKQAIATYEQALVIWRQIGARSKEAVALIHYRTHFCHLV